MFNKNLKKEIDSLWRRTYAMEGEINRLKNPPLYKVGDNVRVLKWVRTTPTDRHYPTGAATITYTNNGQPGGHYEIGETIYTVVRVILNEGSRWNKPLYELFHIPTPEKPAITVNEDFITPL